MINEESSVGESKIRLNMKQNAKGDWYGEYSVRGDTVDEVRQLANEMQKEVEKRSTVKKDG